MEICFDDNLLNEGDLLKPEHNIVLMFFNVGSGKLLRIAYNLSEGAGVGLDFCCFYFWNSLDDYEKTLEPYFDGVTFGSGYDNESVLLSYEEVYHYMSLASKRYVASYPDEKDELESYLAAYRKRFLHATE